MRQSLERPLAVNVELGVQKKRKSRRRLTGKPQSEKQGRSAAIPTPAVRHRRRDGLSSCAQHLCNFGEKERRLGIPVWKHGHVPQRNASRH